MKQIHGIIGLFLLLVVVFLVKPGVINNIYDTILGRIVLLGIVIFFTSHNTTLGLLVALCLIVASNKFLSEGNENMEQTLETESEEESEEINGVDPITAHESIQPLDSATVPVKKSDYKSDEVKSAESVTDKQPFSLMYSEI
jgi:hypothetical protein